MKKALLRVLILLFVALPFTFPQQKKITLNDIYTNTGFRSKSITGFKWIDSGNKYSFIKYDSEKGYSSIYEHDIISGEEKILIAGDKLRLSEDDKPFMIRNYEWSSDERYVLFTGLLPARSTKTGGSFYIYDTEKERFFLLSESDDEQVNAKFSPDGKKLGFVRGNNIFVIDIESQTEKQLTFDGSDVILNGVFDWVYEEEFSIIQAWEWSPDSRSIAYWRLDQSSVPKVFITKYETLYFEPLEQHYPKAGDNNSIVKIGVVDISSAKTMWMDIGEETDIYIPRINFTNDPSVLSIQRLNRPQNKLELMLADINSGKTKIILTETDTCWVDVENDNLRFLNDGKHFIWSSERDGFHHLYLYDINGNLINQVTKGSWEIDKLISVDEENQLIYYTSLERSPLNTDLYSIKFDGSSKKRITEEKGDHTINMSPNNKFYIDRYSNVNTIPSTSIFTSGGKELRKLIESDMSAFEEYDFAQVEFLTFTTSDGVELNAGMIKPTDFDASKKYPVLIYNYSGPGSQTVKDSWSTSIWHHMLSQNGYIIFWLDNRGTGGRGKSFKNIVYKNLGHWELNDLIEGAKFLISTGYVDPERVGIWGSSYGGYMAALAILKGADYFKAAISSAPGTHWKFYDTIYTERYMQTPQLNPEGYEESAPINFVKNLKGKLLLVHGTADDNVHVQNTIVFMKELIKANKQFDVMLYPEAMHGGFGRHFLELMTEFVYNNL
jgi:dipeptidyl-peptidase-4